MDPGSGVQAGDIGELAPARVDEGLADFALNFLKRFNAIGRKGREITAISVMPCRASSATCWTV